MRCIKCQTLPEIPKEGGELLITCEVPDIAKKVGDFLATKNIEFRFEDQYTLRVHVTSFEDFLRELLESNLFKKMIREAINILFLGNRPLTPTLLKEMKTLEYYKQLIDSMQLVKIIQKGALTFYFQPVIELATGEIYGYELLVRGVDDTGELIFPDKLFEWARKGDMLFYLDRACRELSLKIASAKGIKKNIFINFIPTAIYDPQYCLQSTVKWAKQLNFDPQKIIFEVVESEHVEDLEHLKEILQYYQSQGFRVALDDVGSGYSSLNMLIKLHPDIIKVDRGIIDHIDTNDINQSVFKAIAQIAKENNITLLAEGIERVEELEFCKANGANLAQGYYFAKPSAEPVRKLSYSNC